MDQDWIIDKLLILIPLWMSLSVHEWAHAWTAFKLGDDTAALMGRMTLNPLAHVDPIGTLLLPILGVPFGWATPVPVQPLRFDRRWNMSTGMMITAIAGPISNVCIAAVSIVVYALFLRFGSADLVANVGLNVLMQRMVYLNVILALFNMLPIPPLDGSRVADWLIRGRLRPAWESFCQLGPLALGAVIVLPWMAGVSLFAGPIHVAIDMVNLLVRLLGG